MIHLVEKSSKPVSLGECQVFLVEIKMKIYEKDGVPVLWLCVSLRTVQVKHGASAEKIELQLLVKGGFRHVAHYFL